MAIYTKIEASDLIEIIAPYGIEAIDFRTIEGGNANSSYHILTKKEEYILTIAEESTMQEMKQLAVLLQWLKDNDFVTSEVQTTDSGELLTQFAGKPILIKNWISGQVIENFSADMLKQIGRKLAQLHKIPAPEYLPEAQSYGLQSFTNVTNKKIDLKYENWLKEQFNYFKKRLPNNLPKGLIHGDLFFDNILFQDGELKAIIDFEEACYYFLNFDLGMSIVGLCRTNAKIDLRKANALVKGYEEIGSLKLLEKETLKLFIEYAATATSKWRFSKYNILSPNPDFRNRHWEMVQIANEVKMLSKEIFNSIVFTEK